MTNKEAIEILCDQIKGNKSEAMQMALKALCEPNWIPCSERLPEEARSYLVTNSKWGAWCVDRDMFIDGHWVKNDDVIAWMPLPEPFAQTAEHHVERRRR